ncbi:Probable phosphatase YcdX [Leminorella richardii]|uniref:Probable phosphatase YcdX n=2 Tax=Leminorella richardii TaxID=158841 RepID=A0A2X4Y212_9GAMM|nr:Probable phosphatase YcdX [Leminorella richardii]
MRFIMDLHTHTVASGHAYSTLKENLEQARLRGLLAMGISDHASVPPAQPIPYYLRNFKVLTPYVLGIRLLKGVEANIIDFDGNIDVEGNELRRLDYAIASLHQQNLTPGSEAENTRALCGAMKHPMVKIIGHPNDGVYPVDFASVAKAAAESGVALELNNASLRQNSGRERPKALAVEMLKQCVRYGTWVIVGSDSHVFYDVGEFGEAEILLEEVGFPEAQIVNLDLSRLAHIGISV